MAPNVSVIITCYNYGKYLAACIGSVLSQTYRDREIIVVDDGSTDETPEVMQRFASNPSVRYVRQDNAGQANAKNTGISNARGHFVAFLDADDLWEDGKLQKQMPLFGDASVGVVYSRARYIDEEGRPLQFTLQGKYLKPRSGNVTEYLFFDNFIPFSSSIVRRKCLKSIGGFDESLRMGIDWDLWLRISTQYTFEYVDEPLLVYRLGHSGQMSKNLEERQRCSDRIMTKFLEAHPGAISNRTRRDALAYTCCNRGYYYSWINSRTSFGFYLKALRCSPMNISVYYGILALLCKFVIISVKPK